MRTFTSTTEFVVIVVVVCIIIIIATIDVAFIFTAFGCGNRYQTKSYNLSQLLDFRLFRIVFRRGCGSSQFCFSETTQLCALWAYGFEYDGVALATAHLLLIFYWLNNQYLAHTITWSLNITYKWFTMPTAAACTPTTNISLHRIPFLHHYFFRLHLIPSIYFLRKNFRRQFRLGFPSRLFHFFCVFFC